MTALAEIQELTKSYKGQKVLEGISFTIPKEDILCIIGRNGCGKSTLLNILAGMLKPDGGKVLYSKGIVTGYTPQEDLLFPDLSVSDNLYFWAAAAGVKKMAVWDNACTIALEIQDYRKQKVKKLSGGMRRRVAIAAALIKNPDFIILDEPFSGLDLYYKADLTLLLKKLNQLGKTILYTSHSTDEITGLSKRALLIENGRITEDYGRFFREQF